MWIDTPEGRELVTLVSHDLVTQVAPEELDLFDELITDPQGWWANKFGIQAGIKYIDVLGIDHLDAQLEFNSARPYTYTHRDSAASYTHYNQPLAHPLGANFREVVLTGRYQASQKWLFEGKLITAKVGEDEAGFNWGNNLLLPHTSRVMEYGNELLQGVRTDIILVGLDVSYQIKHNVFFDLSLLYRNFDSANDNLDESTTVVTGGFRMNIAKKKFDF